MKGKAWMVIAAISLLVFFSGPRPLLAQFALADLAAEMSMANTDFQQLATEEVQLSAQAQGAQMQRWQIMQNQQTKIFPTQQQLQVQQSQNLQYQKWNQMIRGTQTPSSQNQQPQKTQKDALLLKPSQGQNLNKQSRHSPAKPRRPAGKTSYHCTNSRPRPTRHPGSTRPPWRDRHRWRIGLP